MHQTSVVVAFPMSSTSSLPLNVQAGVQITFWSRGAILGEGGYFIIFWGVYAIFSSSWQILGGAIAPVAPGICTHVYKRYSHSSTREGLKSEASNEQLWDISFLDDSENEREIRLHSIRTEFNSVQIEFSKTMLPVMLFPAIRIPE